MILEKCANRPVQPDARRIAMSIDPFFLSGNPQTHQKEVGRSKLQWSNPGSFLPEILISILAESYL